MTIASGADSSRSRNFSSAFLRPLMSRIALDTSVSSSVSSGLRLISIGNSVPSLRRPSSSRPEPIERTRGSAKKFARWLGCFARTRSGNEHLDALSEQLALA